MSSLLSMVRKSKILVRGSDDTQPEAVRELGERLLSAVNRGHIAVDAQSILDDLYPAGVLNESLADYRGVEIPLTPPYQTMWLEGKWDRRLACSLTRLPVVPNFVFYLPEGSAIDGIDHAKWMVHGTSLYEDNGTAILFGEQYIWLDADGHFIRSLRLQFAKGEEFAQFARMFTAWAVHSLARFNCANVRIVPVEASATAQEHRIPKALGIVWHTIIVRDIVARHLARASGEHREIRSHSVRGHYADYRKGTGLFGRASLRRVFFVREHQRGNLENGQVISDYKLAPSAVEMAK